MSKLEEKVARDTMTKLSMAANHYTNSSPAVARFYMYEMTNTMTSLGREPEDTQQVTCPFCSVIFHPDNYRVTVKPKVKITKKIERLRRKQEAGEALDLAQVKILHWYENGHNKLVLHCETCGKADAVRGGTRNEPIRVQIRKDRLREKQKEEHRRKSQQKSTKKPKMTAAMKKRMKRREKRREHCSSDDSGLPTSLLTSSSQLTSRTNSLSTISLVDGLNSSLSSEGARRLSSASSPFTSTPKVTQRVIPTRKLQTPPDDFIAFLNSIKMAPPVNKSTMSDSKDKSTNKKSKKKKSGMGKLQGLLAQQREQGGKKKGGSALLNFLSSL